MHAHVHTQTDRQTHEHTHTEPKFTMLLAFVIVGLTIKFVENLGPFRNGLLSS